MAATSPPLPSTFLNRRRLLSNLTSFKLLSISLRDERRCRFQCQIKSFENQPPNWSVDFHSGPEPVHLNSTSPMSMPAASASDFSIKTVKRVCLFYCNETKALSERVAAESDTIELRNINWRSFEDGFPNLFIPNAQGIRGQNVAFLASFSSPSVIFEQLSVIYALPKLFISSFTILSNIPTSRGGPTSLVTFDIHALQERFYFGDNILPCFESGIPLLMNRLQQLPNSEKISIAFPDDGAWKRFHKQLQHFPTLLVLPVTHELIYLTSSGSNLSNSLFTFAKNHAGYIICNKVRIGDKRIVRIKEGEAAGRHVVIVDDLVQSGGTLIECQKALAANGAAKISAYVTHGIFPNKSWRRFERDNGGHPENGLTYFWITDSCPGTVKEVMNKSPFEILSLAGSVAAALQK
ncbi:Ribose-phosphate pyrophosphokinase 3 [Hibiscus syriacus]|uniref:Ribose-phosphate pyrophosphokinase 3 n=1 Tax=Hibiscus syriacus TaxID=106335 RepID=A0A6A2ZK91_HIBSY|nr:Ribose-phosphate pyrophosphokinase 3 [Hibiscus syriacus]